MVTPEYLVKGDKVIIISTARKVDEGYIQFAVRLLESWGLKVGLGKNLYARDHQFAGSDADRLADLQAALDDNEIKAIFCARGGYGTIRILDNLRFDKFRTRPKWIVGYSDVTILHCHLQHCLNISSLHATMPVNFQGNSEQSLRLMKDALFGEELSYTWPVQGLNRKGSAAGEIIGGNLSILSSLNGSKTFPETKNKILFLEDLDEYLYHIDRMMINLKRSGTFENLKGMVVGGLTEMRDNEVPFGKTAVQIIADTVSDYDFPVCFGFPAGHIEDNCPIILGRSAGLDVGSEQVTLNFNS